MKIGMILPSLSNAGPVIVAKEIIEQIQKIDERISFTIFYFDEKDELSYEKDKLLFPCECIKLDFNEKYLFENFNVIHTHGYRPNKYIAKNKNNIAAICITTVHCHLFYDLKFEYNLAIALIFSPLWLFFISKHDHIVTLTKSHKNLYGKLLDNKKISVINNGRSVLTKEIDITDKQFFANLPNDKIKLGTFAALTSRKGINQIIKVLPYLKNYILIIIGEGKEKKRLQKLSQKLNVEKQCFFLDYRKEAYRYLKYIDVFMMPSISEGFGLTLIEAAQYGCSCVCSDIKIFTEIWNDNEISFFKLYDMNDLKRAILEATNKKNEKSSAIREKYLSNYTAKIMAQSYLKLYYAVHKTV